MFKKIYIYIFTFGLLLPFSPLLAQYGLNEANTVAGLPQGDVPTFLGRFAGAALALSGSIFLFLIVYGGIMMMTSAGGENVAKGKKIITWAIIGALVLGAAYAITTLIFQIFK
ncbi:MAG: hypothetical protein WC460_02570 [Patescibacteria group bacterium]